MLRTLFATTALALCFSSAQAQVQTGADLGEGIDENAAARMAACGIDAPELERLINLPQQDFDQDFNGGWRPYGNMDGCQIATAELILTYLTHSAQVEPDDLGILRWHAAQMFASGGDYDAAIPLFVAAKSAEASAWNAYADATIAFLRGDYDAIIAAREALMDFAPSPDEQAANQRFLDENPNIRMPDGFVTDPPNLPVVDRLIACWGMDYWTAYTGCEDPRDPAPNPDAATASPLACAFLADRVGDFVGPSEQNGHRMAVGANWLATPGERDQLAAVLRQEGRQSGPDAPFGMAYNEDFAAAIGAMTEADIDAFHAALTTEGTIACDRLDTSESPFEADIAGVQRWAEAQMSNPDPDAPPAVETLSLSRPIFFDGNNRVLVAEAYSFTPIPISRPPSGLIGFTVYVRDGAEWTREAGILLNRMG
ncbi:hypothetical protein NHF40_12985 [Maricaulaceae bacterium EIL42A08]|nr:hypothetical protein [Maricaulaceae bacterium EIL42A08]